MGTSSVVGTAAASFYEQRIRDARDTSSKSFEDAVRQDTSGGLAQRAAIDDAVFDEYVDARLAAIGDGSGFRNAAAAMVGMHNSPLQPRVSEIGVTIHVIAAADDAICHVIESIMFVVVLTVSRLSVIIYQRHM